MSGTFEIKKAKDGEFYFHLKASNGQIILASEMYVAKSSAENGIESVKKNAETDSNYERKDTNFNLWYGKRLGESIVYNSGTKTWNDED